MSLFPASPSQTSKVVFVEAACSLQKLVEVSGPLKLDARLYGQEPKVLNIRAEWDLTPAVSEEERIPPGFHHKTSRWR